MSNYNDLQNEDYLNINTGDGLFMFIAWEDSKIKVESINLYDTANEQHILYQNKQLKSNLDTTATIEDKDVMAF